MAERKTVLLTEAGQVPGSYRGKRVLVTGAAGSVGSALCRALANGECARLGMLDHFDHGLLEIAEEVTKSNPKLSTIDILCDVRDRERLDAAFARFAPDIVIHCAALKHVHLGERHPGECVLTNLVAVRNVLNASVRAGAEQFMLVSSDKAASPVCVMGATKRLAELYLIGFQMERATQMRLKSVRFGNVRGSQGSVTPRFASQIAAGGPLQVTHPEMQRFFMSGHEAVNLILSVIALEDHGAPKAAAYFMEMGEPVSIVDLGHQMIEQSGKKIAIEFTGLRPGEKLKEQLFDEYETASSCALGGVYRVMPSSPDAYLTSADIGELEIVARTAEDAEVRRHVFAKLDACLGRELAAVG